MAGADVTDAHVAWLGPCWAKLRGRPSAGDGWQAVATDGDDQMEMVDNRVHNR